MSYKTVLFLLSLIFAFTSCTKLRTKSTIISSVVESSALVQMISEFLDQASVGLYSLDKSFWAACLSGIFSVESPDYEEEQKFKLEKVEGGYYTFKYLPTGKLLSIRGNNISCDSDIADKNTKFKIEAGPKEKQFYMSAHGIYLSTIAPFTSSSKADAVWNLAITKPAEVIKPIEGLENPKIGLFNGKSRKYAGDNAGVFVNEADTPREQDFVEIAKLPNGYYTIKNTSTGKYLGIKDGKASWDYTDVNDFDKFKAIQYTDAKTNKPVFQLVIGSTFLNSQSPNFTTGDAKDPASYWTIGSEPAIFGKFDNEKTCLLSVATGKWISANADFKIDNNASTCGANQQFKIATNEFGLSTLVALLNNSLLDMKGDQTSTEPAPANINDYFIIEPVGETGLRLKSAVTGKYVSSNATSYVSAIADDSTVFFSALQLPTAKVGKFNVGGNTGLYSIQNLVWASCQPDGELQIDRTWWREWEFVNASQTWRDGIYHIKSTQFNRYFGIKDGKASFRFLDSELGPANNAIIEPAGKYFRVKVGDLYLSADNKPSYVTAEANESTVFTWTTGAIAPLIKINAQTGLYSVAISQWASCQPGGQLEVNRAWYREWEYISVEPADKKGYYYFKSTTFNKYLAIKDGKTFFDNTKSESGIFKVTETEDNNFTIDLNGVYVNHVAPNFTTTSLDATTKWTLKS